MLLSSVLRNPRHLFTSPRVACLIFFSHEFQVEDLRSPTRKYTPEQVIVVASSGLRKYCSFPPRFILNQFMKIGDVCDQTKGVKTPTHSQFHFGGSILSSKKSFLGVHKKIKINSLKPVFSHLRYKCVWLLCCICLCVFPVSSRVHLVSFFQRAFYYELLYFFEYFVRFLWYVSWVFIASSGHCGFMVYFRVFLSISCPPHMFSGFFIIRFNVFFPQVISMPAILSLIKQYYLFIIIIK